jgi:hypothetical protein
MFTLGWGSSRGKARRNTCGCTAGIDRAAAFPAAAPARIGFSSGAAPTS